MDESPLAKMEKACGEIGKNDAVDKKPATTTPSSVRTKGVSPNIRPGSSASEDRKHATNGTHKKDNGDSGKGGNGKINGCGFDKKVLWRLKELGESQTFGCLPVLFSRVSVDLS